MDNDTYWPENVILWGAGATANLNMPTSSQQDEFVTALRDKTDLTSFIGTTTAEYINNCSELEKLLKLIPRSHGGCITIQDTLNFIAINKNRKRSLEIKTTDNKMSYLDISAIEAAAQQLDRGIQLYFKNQYRNLLSDKSNETLNLYTQIYRVLAENALCRKCKLPTNELYKRKNFLLDYAIVNFNWDILLLWTIFNVHRDCNNDSKLYYTGTPPIKLKIFNDFATYLATKSINNTPDKIWYPYNEPMALHINDPEHLGDRRIVLGKFLQVHGSFNWKECPHCGKLNMYLGKDWGIPSNTLFDTDEELKNCLFCNAPFTDEMKAGMRVTQSIYKPSNPPYLEEIQREMLLCISHAKHIIFAGYSLPDDDLIYRSILAGNLNNDNEVKITVLNHEEKTQFGQGFFYDYEKVSEESSARKVLERIANVLKIEKKDLPKRFRFNLEGIPNAFCDENQKVDSEKVLKTFYWSNDTQF